MRNRKDIEDEYTYSWTERAYYSGVEPQKVVRRLTLETLLDIRELLARPGVQNDWGKAKEELSHPGEEKVGEVPGSCFGGMGGAG